jgi:cysteinyl-tRNA synthetase
LSDALDAHGPRAFRMAVLQAHYRKAIELGHDDLARAATTVKGLDALARRARAAGIDASASPEPMVVALFRDEMDDDFSTPQAMAVVFDAVSAAHQALDDGDLVRAAPLVAAVRELTAAVGLELDAGGSGDAEVDAEIDALVARRDELRAARDFSGADAIRDELAGRGIVLEDTPNGTVWHRE